MSPIRVGLVGLSKTASLTNGWTLTAHFPSLAASPSYDIVALCNSTVASAQESIAVHSLGSHVKAYGSPEDLAKDPDVDLVVVSVNIAKHFQIAKPALISGKDVYVEWPLGATTSEAEELATLAKSHGSKTIVGLQTVGDPLIIKLKELVDSGKIGNVLSTTVKGAFPWVSADMWPVSARFFLELDSGASTFQVIFGHYLAGFTHALGPFANLTSILKTQYPTTNIVDATYSVIEPNLAKTAPDHVFVQGTLKSGAVAAVNFRAVDKNIDGTGVRWTITGTEGKIEITIPEMVAWQMETSATFKMYSGKGEIEDVDFKDAKEPAHVSSISGPGPNTARSYEAFAKGETEKYATFDDALVHQRLLDTILKSSSKGRRAE